MNEIERKMIGAYMEANRLQRTQPGELPGTVSLRVGRDCWDWLRSMAIHEDPNETLTRPWLARAWGFPVILDKSFDPDRVIVRKDVVIP